jgi:hypothetical protein
MPRPGGGAEGGLEGEQLAGSCFNAFRNAVHAQGGAFPDWAELDESLQAGFVAAAAHAADFLAGEEQEGHTWKMLGANCYWQFCKAAAETPLEMERIPADTLRAWEAFARHASNMMVFDPNDDIDGGVEGHELYWKQWAADKKARSQMTEQQAAAQRPIEEGI